MYGINNVLCCCDHRFKPLPAAAKRAAPRRAAAMPEAQFHQQEFYRCCCLSQKLLALNDPGRPADRQRSGSRARRPDCPGAHHPRPVRPEASVDSLRHREAHNSGKNVQSTGEPPEGFLPRKKSAECNERSPFRC